VQDILPRIDKRVATYGLAAQADYSASELSIEGLSTSFALVRRGEPMGRFRVRMPGVHHVLNALATIAVADEVGVDHAVTREALATFAGVQRRFTIVGEAQGMTVVDDYGHHPAEIEATLEAARRAYGRRVVVAFQPHRYSRTHHLFDELTRAFNRADVLLVTDVYAAGEAPIEGADSAHLVEAIRAHGHRDVTHVARREDLVPKLLERCRAGDVVITLGAGSITRSGPELLRALGAA
jgi:UDP-N-acetylmuramate--alanine ligase